MPDTPMTRSQMAAAQQSAARQLAQAEGDLTDQLTALLAKPDVQALAAFAKANYEPDMTGGGGLNQQLKYLTDMLTSVPMSLAYVRNNLNQTLAQTQSAA